MALVGSPGTEAALFHLEEGAEPWASGVGETGGSHSSPCLGWMLVLLENAVLVDVDLGSADVSGSTAAARLQEVGIAVRHWPCTAGWAAVDTERQGREHAVDVLGSEYAVAVHSGVQGPETAVLGVGRESDGRRG